MKRLMMMMFAGLMFGALNMSAQVADEYVVDNGKVHVKKFYDDGTLRETGTYVNNVPSGNWIQYYPDGSIHIEAYFDEGEKAGKWFVWSEDGTYLYELVYADNRMKNSNQWRIEQRNMLASE